MKITINMAVEIVTSFHALQLMETLSTTLHFISLTLHVAKNPQTLSKEKGFFLPASKTFLISSISNCNVNRSRFVWHRITVTAGDIVASIRDSILKIREHVDRHIFHSSQMN